MKSTRNRLRVFYFGLLLTTAIAFVVASLWLILKVNHKRDKVEQFVTQIDVISDLELSVMECLDLYEGEKEEKFQKAIQELTNRDFQLDQFPELTNLSKKTRDLKVYFGDSGVQMDFIPFRQDLQDLYFTAIEEKKENRKTLGLLSVELSNYWNYTHLLIVLACGLSLILLAVAVVFFRSKRKLENLQFKNSMFLNSVTDCVIVCSNEGTIIEFNETSVETFGYSK